jgi:methylenetetrahydrofolate reductase (NADPH)
MSFSQAIKDGEFLITAQCTPPQDSNTTSLDACASALKDVVHALYVSESEDGVRLSSLTACSHLVKTGVESIMALITRDKNRIALQSSILGAASMGITNILCTSGRHQTLTSSGSAKGVYDLDPIQLLQMAKDMPVEITLGTDTNPFAEPVELNVMVLKKAIKAGAEFVITQPVFDIEKFSVWMDAVRESGIQEKAAIIASVLPIASAEQAASYSERYDIPDEVIKNAGAQQAADIVSSLKKIEGVRGIHIMGDDFELASQVIKSGGVSRS